MWPVHKPPYMKPSKFMTPNDIDPLVRVFGFLVFSTQTVAPQIYKPPKDVLLSHVRIKKGWCCIVSRSGRCARGKDGNGAVSGRISAGFGSCGFRFEDDFSPTVFGFGAPKPIGFGFPPVDIQWISEINHLELKLMFYNMLIITYLLILLNLF